jgi:hypothetical protein
LKAKRRRSPGRFAGPRPDGRSTPLAGRCITERVHILASACMNRMPRFRGPTLRLRQQAFGSSRRSQPLEAKRSPLELEAAFRPGDSRQGYAACWGMPRPHGQRRNSRPPSARKQGPPNVSGYHRQAARHRQASRASLALGYSNRRSRCGLGPEGFQAPRQLLARLPCPANAMRGRGSCLLQPGASITGRPCFCRESAVNLVSLSG